MNIQGKLHRINPTVVVSDKFQRRAFVVEFCENPMYPQYIQLEFTQDRCAELDAYKTGDSVDVTFNLKGRPWTDTKTGEEKFFNTLEAWRIKKAESAPQPVASGYSVADLANDEMDDLPY